MSCPMPTQPPPAITSAFWYYITEITHRKALLPGSQVHADMSSVLLIITLQEVP